MLDPVPQLELADQSFDIAPVPCDGDVVSVDHGLELAFEDVDAWTAAALPEAPPGEERPKLRFPVLRSVARAVEARLEQSAGILVALLSVSGGSSTNTLRLAGA